MQKHTISFQNALNGIWIALSTQINIRIHFVVASLVLVFSVYLHLSISEILVLVLSISMVMLAEMVNTGIEFLSDAVTLEQNENIKRAKDVSAGAVLLSAIFAALIGIMIFIPKLI